MVDYQLRVSDRAKRISIVVHWNGICEVILPANKIPSEKAISSFIAEHENWIEKNVIKMKKNADKKPLSHQGVSKKVVTDRTRILVANKVDHYCQNHGFKIGKLIFKNYKTRWGSCSKDRHLSFHYKLSLLPGHLAEYIIIHELCHTVHFNHSKQFWLLVEQYCADHKVFKKELKTYLL